MASNYTGNATAAQAPATAPAVNNPVIIVIPAGTDVRTIESITQALKVSADNHTFELQILGGTRTAKSLVVDATGGTVSSGVAGDVNATGNVIAGAAVGASEGVFDGSGGTVGVAISGAVTVTSTAATGVTAPTPSFHKGTLYKDTVPLAWGCVSGNALICGVNVASVTHAGTGSYSITLNVGASSIAKLCPIVTTAGENIVASAGVSAANAFSVITAAGQTAPSGGRIDKDFFFVVFGG